LLLFIFKTSSYYANGIIVVEKLTKIKKLLL
jgi:hypothetical protein